MADDDPTTYRDIGWFSDTTEVTDGVHYLSTFSACTAFETDEGVVLVDSGLQELGPDLAERLREHTDAPVHTCIYTHGHIDHVHGLPGFVDDQDGADSSVPDRRSLWPSTVRLVLRDPYRSLGRHPDRIARRFSWPVSSHSVCYEYPPR